MIWRRSMTLAGMTTIVVTLASVVVTASAGARPPPVVRPTQQLAVLLDAHKAISALRTRPARAGTVRASRPITGARTVLPVVRRAAVNGVDWLRVMLPGRPNGSKGWIKQRGTVLTSTSWHLVVRTSTRRLLVYRSGHLIRTVTAIVGKPSTPTPHGRFFVEESVRMLPGSAGAPFALALSARSNVLQEFEGGPGQIAIHGIANLGGTLGTAVSHGCVRLANRAVSWLAARIPAGTPVAITR
jgi:lipoprotein-anchoring transpeptidase ErfK/SrfK